MTISSNNWNKRNRKRMNEIQRKYYKKNKEKIDAKLIEDRKNNPDKHHKYYKTAYDKNPYKKNLIKRANKANIIELFTIKEWQQKAKNTEGICPNCKNDVGVEKLTLDHIYPISKAEPGRVYTINDIQPLCKSCNSKKGCLI